MILLFFMLKISLQKKTAFGQSFYIVITNKPPAIDMYPLYSTNQ